MKALLSRKSAPVESDLRSSYIGAESQMFCHRGAAVDRRNKRQLTCSQTAQRQLQADGGTCRGILPLSGTARLVVGNYLKVPFRPPSPGEPLTGVVLSARGVSGDLL